MLDVHLAEIYGVETRALKQAVRRNMDLFPEDFMFELSENEIDAVVSQNVIHLDFQTVFRRCQTFRFYRNRCGDAVKRVEK